ncbi:enkurin isoform X2 [Denticeps clupeoides]|uniref:enkurin isoform X2 n=1 Tax=Denticeps clupeoides TaxID=299321 RepID=UPI0010A44492|nr:enkurin isoform X2 [Denticeps clupeoides]
MSSTVCPPESIYNLIPREEVKDDKPPRYMSKFREQTKLERQANKAASRTMGPAKVEAPAPEKFLLKHSKEPRLPDKKPFSYPDNTARKAPLPVNTDPAGAGSSARKDFVKTNAMETIAATARRPQPVYADTKTGHKNLLENSGLVPKYLKKKDFGQTPDYILQRREEARRAQQQFDRYVAEHVEQGSMKQLSREEKDAILQVHSLADLKVAPCSQPGFSSSVSLFHSPGSQAEMGRAEPPVPGPVRRHGYGPQEEPQGAPGAGDEAAGKGHCGHGAPQDHLHLQQLEQGWTCNADLFEKHAVSLQNGEIKT